MIWSISESGNFKGSFVVSMSYARTTGSARCKRSSIHLRLIAPCLASTVYHFPIRIPKNCQCLLGHDGS